MNLFAKATVLSAAIWSALIAGVTTGCASGGFKLTRQYAGFVNRQPIILRVILYIFTFVVFGVTLIIDSVVFNTIDFWEGRVSQGTYHFNKDGKAYAVHHKVLPESGLRESHIVISQASKTLQEILLRETASLEIEVFIDGILKGRVTDLADVPKITMFDSKGRKAGIEVIPNQVAITAGL